MPSLPFQGGFGLLTLDGVPKPAYRAFELLHRLGTDELIVDGVHETVRVWAIRRERSITMLVTNHALPRHPMHTELVHLVLSGMSAPKVAYVERIDDDHANAKRTWEEMGAPEYPSRLHVEQLHAASRLVKEPLAVIYRDRTIQLDVAILPHAVAAITIECEPSPDDDGTPH